jgi:FtsP/CotA-like multicopper oxidase with cupredoxin domain
MLCRRAARVRILPYTFLARTLDQSCRCEGGIMTAPSLLLIGALSVGAFTPVASASDAIGPNDNQHAAGTLTKGTLTLKLETRQGVWEPAGADGPKLTVAAFVEEGQSPLTPGPLIRVSEGTRISISVHNTLSEPLLIHGFLTRPASADTLLTIPVGETREVAFVAGAPGVYHYWGVTGKSVPIRLRKPSDSQLGGAIVVDPKNAHPDTRVFVISEWLERGQTRADAKNLLAINGQSWPFTERLTQEVGKTARWQWVNLSATTHPMHLHGFYFTVHGTGTGLEHHALAPADARLAVTEHMPFESTMDMSWTADRPGNWLFHCHLLGHISPEFRFWRPDAATPSAHEHDPAESMTGLVLAISVTGNAPAVAATTKPARELTLAMYHRPHFFQDGDAADAFAIKTGESDPTPADVTVPGPPLILTRGEPVAITLKNGLNEPTAIHWHGIELESYYDGVPGLSGLGANTTPAIEPGGSFVVRFTPPRAGTFMYHTHNSRVKQLGSGLYGAVIVTEPGETFDPAVDHLVVIGLQGPADQKRPDRIPIVVNGSPTTRMTLKAGVPNRLRLIDIATSQDVIVSLLNFAEPVMWRPVAKDGATLPATQQKPRSAADQIVAVGETYDFELMPPDDGSPLWLDVRQLNGRFARQVPITVVK